MALSLGGGAISADIYTVQYSGDKKTDYTFTAEWKESATPRSTPSSTGRPAVPQTGDGSAPPPCRARS